MIVAKTFDELNIQELYQILRLRSEVFVVELDCVYQDLDNKDFVLKIKNQSDQDLHINSINIIGHKHLGYIFDRSGMPSRFKNLIKM